MTAFLLSIILFVQGIPLSPMDTGTITGILKTAAGAPAAGIRVTALNRPETLVDAANTASSASLAETDSDGRYRLENIPPGSYYISAGRVDLPTYFPGTLEMLKGTPVAVTPRAVVSNIDFVLDEVSARREGMLANITGAYPGSGLTMPVQVRMEGEGKQPIFSDGHSVLVRLTRLQDQSRWDLPLNDTIQNFPIPNSLPGIEYRVTVENLPRGYVVRSLIQDGVDLKNDLLKITGKNFGYSSVTLLGATAPGAIVNNVRNASTAAPMTPLEITLAAVPQSSAATSGVRVTGRSTSAGVWNVSLSGMPGILFADGSFEFRGVAPGRHVILLQDNPASPTRTLAASVVVGDKDLDDVLADDTRVLPAEVRFPSITHSPGSIPLAWLRGRVSDEASKNPVFGGLVTLVGKTRVTFQIDNEGKFEMPRLLPGVYELSIDGFEHATIRQPLIVGDEDVQLNVSARAIN